MASISDPVRSHAPTQMPAPINQRKRASVSLGRQQKKALRKKQIQQRKIVIKIHNSIDNALPALTPLPQYTISGKLNNISLPSLLSKPQLSQLPSHSNNTKSINTTIINTNDSNNNNSNNNNNNNSNQQRKRNFDLENDRKI